MTKRNLFAELTEGFDALAAARKGKKTLRTTEVELKPVVEVSADELRAIREKWTSHATVDKLKPQFEARSNTSGLTPPKWLWRRVRL